MTAAEPFPTCRRKSMLALGLSLATLGVTWGLQATVTLPDMVLGILVGMAVGGLFAAALLWFSPDMSDAMPKRLVRRYQREMGLAMAAYFGVMLFWKRLLEMVDATWLRVLVALFPALLVCWMLRAFVRYVRDSDELQRRIELESGAIAGLLVSAIYLGAGFLQSADLIAVPAKVAMLWVFPLLCLIYGITKVVIARLYA